MTSAELATQLQCLSLGKTTVNPVNTPTTDSPRNMFLNQSLYSHLLDLVQALLQGATGSGTSTTDFRGSAGAALTTGAPFIVTSCRVMDLPSAVGMNGAEVIVADLASVTNGTVTAAPSTNQSAGSPLRGLVRSNNTNWLVV